MPYATEADLDAKWGAETVTLASWNAALVPPDRDASRVTAALANAAATIDGYLARRYPLPVQPTASGLALLVSLACDLAMGQLANTPGTRNEIVVDAEKRAIAYLKDMARGDAALDVVPSPEAGSPISPGEAIVVAPAVPQRDRWGRL